MSEPRRWQPAVDIFEAPRPFGSRGTVVAAALAYLGVLFSSSCMPPRGHDAGAKDPRPPAQASALASPPSASAANPPSEIAPTPYVWQNVAILGGGFVTGIIFNLSERGLFYLRTDVGGAYRWHADKSSFSPLLDWVSPPDWNLHGVESLATDPSDPRRVYIAAGTYTNPAVSDGEMLRSDDYGSTWQRTPVPFKMGGNEAGRGNGERLAVDPHDADVLYFGSRKDGLWRSRDRGVTWSRVGSFPDVVDGSAAYPSEPGKFNYLSQTVGIVFVRFDPRSGRPGAQTKTIYAAVSTPKESLFRSVDGGDTWHSVPGQPLGFRPNRSALGSDGSLFVTYGDEPGPNGMKDGAVFKLDTKTGAWTDVTPEKPSAVGGHFGYAAVSVDAQNPKVVVVTTWYRNRPFDEIFRSHDGGATWTGILQKADEEADWDHSAAPYTKTMRHHWMCDVEIDPFDSNHILFTTGYGIWVTHNATDADAGRPTRWSFEEQGLEETVPLALMSPPEGAHLVSGVGDIDGFRHEDLAVSPPEGRFDAPGFKNTEWLDFAGRAPSVFVRTGTTYGHDRILGAYSRDAGVHWKGFATEPSPPEGGRPFATGPIAVSADGKTIVWTTEGNRPHASRDDGATWQAVGGTPVGLRLVADRVDPTLFYGFMPSEGALYVSRDGATSATRLVDGFAVVKSGRRWRDADVRAVPDRAGDLWIAADGTLVRVRVPHAGPALARPGGTPVVTRIESATDVTSVGFGQSKTQGGYPAVFVAAKVAAKYGIFRSDDEGIHWVRLNDDAHQFATASHVTGDPRVFGRVYFATGGRGILYGEPAH